VLQRKYDDSCDYHWLIMQILFLRDHHMYMLFRHMLQEYIPDSWRG